MTDCLGHPVVEAALVGDVREGVDVAVALVVVVDADVVLGEAHAAGPDVLVGQHRHVVIRRLGVVDPVLGVERQAERHRDARADEPRRRDHALRREVVERSALGVLGEGAPVRDLREQLPELLLGHPAPGLSNSPSSALRWPSV